MRVSVVNVSFSRGFWVPLTIRNVLKTAFAISPVRQWIIKLGDLLCCPTLHQFVCLHHQMPLISTDTQHRITKSPDCTGGPFPDSSH
jgi:hypothetical protein